MAKENRVDPKELDAQIRLIARGDAEAFEQMYRDTRTAVFSFSLSILQRRQDAEDAMHDCYLRVYRASGSYRPMGNPMAWVLTVARNCCLAILRDRKKETLQEGFPDLAEINASAEDRLALSECMHTLSDEERQIVVLHAVSGLKHREIADLLGMPLSTVLSKYNRAMAKLRARL